MMPTLIDKVYIGSGKAHVGSNLEVANEGLLEVN